MLFSKFFKFDFYNCFRCRFQFAFPFISNGEKTCTSISKNSAPLPSLEHQSFLHFYLSRYFGIFFQNLCFFFHSSLHTYAPFFSFFDFMVLMNNDIGSISFNHYPSIPLNFHTLHGCNLTITGENTHIKNRINGKERQY